MNLLTILGVVYIIGFIAVFGLDLYFWSQDTFRSESQSQAIFEALFVSSVWFLLIPYLIKYFRKGNKHG